jgi:hypothetical protein
MQEKIGNPSMSDDQSSANPAEVSGEGEGPVTQPTEQAQKQETASPEGNGATRVVETGKAAVVDTWFALKQLRRNPTGDLQKVLEFLGDDRAFRAGIVLSLGFVLSVWLVVQRISNDVFGLFSSFIGSSFLVSLRFEHHLLILFFAAVPIALLLGVFLLCKQVFKKAGNYKQLMFIAAFTFLPTTAFLLIASLLGFRNGDLLAILSVFCSSTTILVLNSALTEVLKLSSRTAMILVPIILIAVLAVSARIYAAILTV